jgi:hypothetical protein
MAAIGRAVESQNRALTSRKTQLLFRNKIARFKSLEIHRIPTCKAYMGTLYFNIYMDSLSASIRSNIAQTADFGKQGRQSVASISGVNQWRQSAGASELALAIQTQH